MSGKVGTHLLFSIVWKGGSSDYSSDEPFASDEDDDEDDEDDEVNDFDDEEVDTLSYVKEIIQSLINESESSVSLKQNKFKKEFLNCTKREIYPAVRRRFSSQIYTFLNLFYGGISNIKREFISFTVFCNIKCLRSIFRAVFIRFLHAFPKSPYRSKYEPKHH